MLDEPKNRETQRKEKGKSCSPLHSPSVQRLSKLGDFTVCPFQHCAQCWLSFTQCSLSQSTKKIAHHILYILSWQTHSRTPIRDIYISHQHLQILNLPLIINLFCWKSCNFNEVHFIYFLIWTTPLIVFTNYFSNSRTQRSCLCFFLNGLLISFLHIGLCSIWHWICTSCDAWIFVVLLLLVHINV